MRKSLAGAWLGVLIGGLVLGLPVQAADVFVNADINVSTTWTSDNEYILTEVIYVTDGATLTIEPGTVIRGEGESAEGANDPGTLVITRGSKLFALGNAQEPITFTDLFDDNIGDSAGTGQYASGQAAFGLTAQWGGLIVLGRTYVANDTESGPDASREVQIEGLVPDARGLYGNCSADLNVFPNCDDDDSGVVRYTSIRYGGFNLSDANEINGLTLGAVGRGTNISFVEVFQNQDDGIEFFGGTVGLNHFIVANAGDDSLDYDEGFRGQGQFGLVLQGYAGPTDFSDKGGEWDGANNPDGSQPYGIPVFANLTMIGLGDKVSDNTALHMRDGAGGRVYNSAFLDFGGGSVLIEGDPTDPDSAGARAATNMTAGQCTGGGIAPTFCDVDADCPATETCQLFFNGLDSTFQLEFEHNTFWCIGNGSVLPSTGAEAEALGGDNKDHYGDSDGYNIFANGSLNNELLTCADPLPIRALQRTPIGSPALPDPVFSFDPLPASGSSLTSGARTLPLTGFFKPADYRGAFGNENWASSWSTLARLGYIPRSGATIRVEQDITQSETWTADNTYILGNPVYVINGSTLTIEAGTVIRGETESAEGANDPGTLIVTRGSKIDIQGTADLPVVMTDLNDDNIAPNKGGTGIYANRFTALGQTAQWGGLILLGRTYVANDTLNGPDASREVQIEGLVPDARGLYGNCAADLTVFPNCDDDDSGSIQYLSLRYGGFNLSDANEINGLTLGAVGRGTDISFVEIFQNQDDGVEFFGGTVNTRNIAVANAGDDSIDYDEGFRGQGQFWYVQHGQAGSGDFSDKGAEQDGANNPDGSQPYGMPAFYNVTMVGLGQNLSDNTALHFRDNAGGRYYNSAFIDFGGGSVMVEGDPTDLDSAGARATTAITSGECTGAGNPPTFCNLDGDCPASETCQPFFNALDSTNQLELEDNVFYCIGNGNVLPSTGAEAAALGGDDKDHYGDADGFNIFSNGALDNTLLDCVDPLPIRSLTRLNFGAGQPEPVNQIDPRPAVGSPLASTNRTAPGGFFQAANYKGAFSANDNWLAGWTNLDRLGYLAENTERVDADITTSTTWNRDTVYILDRPIYVTDGATLTIEAGTVIRGEGESSPGANDPGTLIVTRGSKIDAVGSPWEPIVFTDLNDDNIGGQAGSGFYQNRLSAIGLTAQWGGVIVLGRTYVANDTENGPDASREVQIEGLVPDARGLYGNCAATIFPDCDDDDSGRMQYVSIRYGGFNLSDANEINGLTLGAVGRGSDIGYVEVFQNQDDGVEFFGGTVNTHHMVVANAGDDSIDYDEGFRGQNQFWFVMQGQAGAGDFSDKGAEQDGANNPDGSQPYGIPAFYNVTMVGLGQNVSDNTALHFRDNAGGRYYNSTFLDFGGGSVLIEGDPADPDSSGARATTAMSAGECTGTGNPPTFCNVDTDCPASQTCQRFFDDLNSTNQLELEDNTFYCIGNGSVLPSDGTEASALGGDDKDHYGDTDGFNIFSNASLDNELLSCVDPLPIRSLTRLNFGPGQPEPTDQIDPRAATGSPLLTTDRTAPGGFYLGAGYRGAFAASNWARHWTNMDRLGYFPTCDGQNGVLPDEVGTLQCGGLAACTGDETSGVCEICNQMYPDRPDACGAVATDELCSWTPVLGDAIGYNVLRTRGFDSSAASDFSSAFCLEADDLSDRQVLDKDVPISGEVFFYLVQSANECGDGGLGLGQDFAPRAGGSCL